MKRKGFVNILLVILVVILAGAVGYLTLVKKPTSQPAASEQSQVQNNAPTQPTVDNQFPLASSSSPNSQNSATSSSTQSPVHFDKNGRPINNKTGCPIFEGCPPGYSNTLKNISVYTNTKYGFQINNPKNETIDEPNSNYRDALYMIMFYNASGDPDLSLQIISANNKPLSYFLDQDNINGSNPNIQISNVSIAGNPAVRVVLKTDFNPAMQYRFLHNGFYYLFHKTPETKITESEFDAMANSIQFSK